MVKMALNAKLKQAMQVPLYHFIPEFSMKKGMILWQKV
nr:MAG TPA: hypothetical protein [Caudoviricetes sp.]